MSKREQYLTSKEVAARAKIAVRTLWKWVDRGWIPEPIRLNRRVVRWRESDVDAALEHLGDADRGKGVTA